MVQRARRARVLALIVCTLAGCGTRDTSGPAVVATVDGVAITAAELDRALAQPLARMDEQIYQLRRQQLEQAIADQLIAAEAKRRSVSVDELLEREIDGAVSVDETAVESVFALSRARWTGTDAALREAIRAELRMQREEAVRQALVDTLKASATITRSLPLPAPFGIEVPIDGAAAVRGADDAPVLIVEFTDFHCPYCRAVQPTLAEIERRYGPYVRLVQHDMPIDQLHPDARAVHVAARCAGAQDRFWPFRERAFSAAPADEAGLTAIASELQLDLPRFQACRSSASMHDAVDRDLAIGRSLGIASTPTFFINGRLVLGARALDEFAPFIEEELRLAGIEVSAPARATPAGRESDE
jgi:protein-disulfide isomerase